MHKADHLMVQMRKKVKCKGNPMFIGFFICLLCHLLKKLDTIFAKKEKNGKVK